MPRAIELVCIACSPAKKRILNRTGLCPFPQKLQGHRQCQHPRTRKRHSNNSRTFSKIPAPMRIMETKKRTQIQHMFMINEMPRLRALGGRYRDSNGSITRGEQSLDQTLHRSPMVRMYDSPSQDSGLIPGGGAMLQKVEFPLVVHPSGSMREDYHLCGSIWFNGVSLR